MTSLPAALPPRRAVVTGGTGFIGANLVRRLLDGDCAVHLLVRPGHDDWRIAAIRDRLSVHVLDIADPAAVRRVFQTVRPDCVFHLAAHGAYSWQRDAGAMQRVNLDATRVLAEAALALGVPGMVHAGSSSEYGRKAHAPDEDTVPEPEDDYGTTKAAATAFCRDFAARHGLRLPTLRIYSAYGAWEDPRRLVPMLLTHALEGLLPPLVDPRTARDFIAVEDVVEAFLLAATRPLPEPGAILNLGTGRQTRIEDIVALVRRMLPVGAEPRWNTMPARHWDTDTWVADNRRMADCWSWHPPTTLADGLRRTLDWLRSTPEALARYRAASRTGASASAGGR